MKYVRIVIRTIGVLLVNLLVIVGLYYMLIPLVRIFLHIKIEENITFITALVIPFTVSIIAYFKDEFQAFILSPSLTVSFKMEEPYITLCDISNLEGVKIGKAHCIKLLIENIGIGVAKNCYVIIHHRSIGEAIDKSFQPLSLSWTNWKNMYRDLYFKSNGIFIDLIRLDGVSGSFARICFHGMTPGQNTEQYIPHSQEAVITPDEPCNFKVTVFSENIKPVTKKVNFKWNGEWNDDFRNIFEIKVT